MIINQTYELETLNFSGLPLAGLHIDAHYADYAIDFATPNPMKGGDCTITLTSGDFTATNLLNSRFERVTVRTVSGRIRMTFDGLSLENDISVRLESESGDILLTVPEGVPAHITFRTHGGALAIFSAPITQIDSTTYRTENYDKLESPRLRIDIDTVMANVRLTGM